MRMLFQFFLNQRPVYHNGKFIIGAQIFVRKTDGSFFTYMDVIRLHQMFGNYIIELKSVDPYLFHLVPVLESHAQAIFRLASRMGAINISDMTEIRRLHALIS